MKRFHIHVAVTDLTASIRFYSALFATGPTVVKDDYAKWMLDDPRINFAISQRGATPGVDHLGVQVENEAELAEMHDRLEGAALPVDAQIGTACCYVKSNKYWTVDPQGIAWESYHTLNDITVFGESRDTQTSSPASEVAACCAPSSGKPVGIPVKSSSCC
ncbi:glyoxalase/bleomycin resistance/dioxygenase family protein [Paraburkholderia dipogonis]|uniref:Glyoxalase/bleomycin resistance/dioxygenase family protein n=1 Tax=Paraburkholderia dipogonis TaxID=1211383 RepID=A0A4Y8MK99_9BURK|nr:ArsI/CadI family heavy metal resistance metalloenzyme [Paraburkholderia dipogonis]TFE37143.1 glyoxalase/bleomycin resistance/dioxygenase family protein [Paraburkholderia dipogonis]TFE37285.1 glyoxalase/bleomycin resistance/dioxygenase family protein [Paraburkholderia dipogonis]TFE37896.1 glyoxalase/bleomycin resistance/dioxygenase family protein [Paraburkholderia dipogonis]